MRQLHVVYPGHGSNDTTRIVVTEYPRAAVVPSPSGEHAGPDHTSVGATCNNMAGVLQLQKQ